MNKTYVKVEAIANWGKFSISAPEVIAQLCVSIFLVRHIIKSIHISSWSETSKFSLDKERHRKRGTK